jgi:hypothetical protein
MLDLFLKTTTTKVNPFNYTTTTNETDFFKWLDGASAVLIVLAIFAFLIVTAICVLMIVANCKIFKKAGEDWWKALIPLYNSWVETRIAGLAWYWFLIFAGLTALVDSKWNSIVFGIGLCLVSFNYCYGIAKKFGKSAGFAVLMTLLPVIGFPILAFGSAKYDSNAKVDPNGIFSVKK